MNARLSLFRIALCAGLIGLASGVSLFAQAGAASAGVAGGMFRVKDSAPTKLLQMSRETGRLAGNRDLGRMVLVLAPGKAQEAAAAKLVASQHDPASPSYHKWLTPAEFGNRFGVSQEGAAKASQWLQAQGFAVHSVAQSRRFIVFSGNVAQVERAFATEMYSYAIGEKSFVSNASDVQIPVALRDVVKGVTRLHSDPAGTQMVLGKKVPFQKKTGQFTFGDGSHYITPADFAKIYNVQPLYDAGIDGTGQTIAIVGRSNINVQDVRDFRNLLNLPANDPQVIVNGDDPGQTGDVGEAMIDVTWSGAVAPKATIKFVVSQSNFADGVDVSAAYIVDNDLAPVMSTSYGACEQAIGPVEADFYNALWQQAAAEGITSFVSSGDNGGAGCDAPGAGLYSSGVFAVNGLASTPYNVAVGGTQFDDTANPDAYWSQNTDAVTGESALGYIPERVWNESNNDPNAVLLYSGSGGASLIYAKPDWQVGTGVPADGVRDVPDISLSAALHDAYLFCFNSYCSYGEYFYTAGGTSVSSPAAAGIMALVNQKMGGQPQGLANTILYRLAAVPGIFHDTVVGDNKVPDPSGLYTVGYDAGVGYDLASGLGSFDANALVNHWQAAAASTGTATTLALAGGQAAMVVHGSSIALKANVTCSGGGACTTPVGSVVVAGTSGGATVTAAPTALDALGNADIVDAAVPGGSYSLVARYGGDGTHTSSASNAVAVTVTPEPSQTFAGLIGGGSYTQAPLTIQYGLAYQVGLVVAGNSGKGYPTGMLTLTADGQPVTTYSYDRGTGALTPSLLTLNYGENSQLLSSLPSSESSTVSYIVPTPALGAGPHTLVASYPGDASFGSSQGSYNYNVTPAQGQIVDFFPAGTQIANVPVDLDGQVAFTNNGYADYGGTMTITDITDAVPVVLGSGPLSALYGGSYDILVTETKTGTRNIRVDYSGDKNVLAAFQIYQVPFPANTSSYTSLSVDNANPYAGQTVTLTANVSSDLRHYTATGTVSFLNGTTSIGSAALDANGNATLVLKSLPAGVDSLSAVYPGDTALQASSSSPTIGTVADYVLQALPATLSIQDGQSGTAAVNLVPLGGFAQAVTLACSGAPANGSCTLSKASVTLDGLHPVTVTVTINTAATVAAMRESGLWKIPSGLALAGLLLLPFSRHRQVRRMLCLVVLLAITAAGVGCGSSGANNKVAVGSYNLTITATGPTGTVAKTVTFAVNVTK